MSKHYCPFCGKILVPFSDKNNYPYRDFVHHDDFDKITGEKLYRIRVKCNCRWFFNYESIIAENVGESRLKGYIYD